ncbi:MAG TPA: PAS domain S-box protein [Thermoanaerobaculia bacterium]|nr:PAS domain S-box protein [Thermoanaerobaculia bacterium]
MPFDEITAFHTLLNSTPNVIYFVDRDGRYRFVGTAAAASLAQTPETMIGRTPEEVGISNEIATRFDAQRREVMSTGRTITEESTYEMPGGRQTFAYTIAPVMENGEAVGVLVVARDVTNRRDAESALRASEEKFSIAFARSPLALTITSLDDGKLVEVNEGFVRMSGYTRDEAIGRSPDELGLWIDPQRRAERFERMRAGKDVPEIEARFRVRNGEVLTGVVASAVVQIDGRPCVLSSVVDITHRKRAEEALRRSEARIREFADTAPATLWITERDGACSFLSRGWHELTGQTEEQSLGFGWLDAVHPADRTNVHAAMIAASEQREPFAIDFRVRRSDGEYRWAIDSGRPRFGTNGEVAGYIGSIIDITDRKLAEQAKDEFLATLSHELRTPLTSAFGWVKLLARTNDPELAQSGMRAIEESLVTQIRLIDDLLDVSRVAAGKMHVHLQPVDLGGIVDAAVEMVRPAAQAKDIDLRVDLRAVTTIEGDAARLRQVFWNLLSNAVKFTPAGGRVDVGLRERDGNAEVIVHDSGEGIEQAFLPHVFERFRQADSSISRRHGGLGIGLSIVSSLVAAHGGSVYAGSDGLDRGATFTVTLPLIERSDTVRPAAAPEDRARHTALEGVRALIVDDDAGTRELMRITLAWAGAEVRECSTAAEAFAMAAQWRPDVLISDLAMPHEDGFGLIRRIRESHDAIPAIAITAYARAEDEERAKAAGFQRHVAKPFDPRDLIEVVRGLVR